MRQSQRWNILLGSSMLVRTRPQVMPVMLVLMLMCSSAMFALTASAVDGDNDGIDDAVDDCPFAWGNSTISYAGCPDSDGDGNPNFGVNTRELVWIVVLEKGKSVKSGVRRACL